MNNLTTGTWAICYDGKIDASDGKFVCSFRWSSFKEFNEGNNAEIARLIAASPDILKSLKVLVEAYGGDRRDREPPMIKDARAAIAKAEGAK